MKKSIRSILVTLLAVPALFGCKEKMIYKEEKFELKEINKYFFEIGTYTSFDYQFVSNYFAKENDNWGGGCSAISKVIDGKRIVGRNMDLNISNKCAYLVNTQVPGKYPTIGLSYTFRDVSQDYEDLKRDGLSPTWEKIVPFMCDDVMNSEGLHVELNMRHGETDELGNDVFGVEHTNKQASERVYVFNLCQYLALNCKNLNECKNYLANNVDVYSQSKYWNYCFLITDADGNSNLLEFGKNNYYWIEPNENGVVGQTNFYLNSECNSIEKIKTGLGRYDALLEGIGSVNSKKDMYDLMKKVQFSSYYLPYEECKNGHFDPRSEVIGEEIDLDVLAYLYSEIMGEEYKGTDEFGLNEQFVLNDSNETFVSAAMDILNDEYRGLTRKQRQDYNCYWESTFTEVVDPSSKTIDLRLFEDESYLYRISFEGVKKLNSIE